MCWKQLLISAHGGEAPRAMDARATLHKRCGLVSRCGHLAELPKGDKRSRHRPSACGMRRLLPGDDVRG